MSLLSPLFYSIRSEYKACELGITIALVITKGIRGDHCMESQKKVSLAQIDCFHWEELDSTTYKLTYYDEQGKLHERTIPKTDLQRALNIFDGKTHLIKRSSGAYSPATPTQLLIYHHHNSTQSSPLSQQAIKITAKFIDLERDNNGLICSNKLIVYFKNVQPTAVRVMEERTDPFKHQYWLDLGPEIIPVTVFDFFRDDKELIRALFVKSDELKEISKKSRGLKQQITVYSAPEAILRVSLPEESQEVIEQHTQSRSIARPSIKVEIPQLLQFGRPLLIPTGSPMEVLTHYLRVCHDPHSIKIKQSFLSVLEKRQTESQSHLLPFGVFESP